MVGSSGGKAPLVSTTILRGPTVVTRANPVIARRQRVRETAYLLLAILLAIVGQGFVSDRAHGSLALGLVLYAVAVALTTRVAGSLYSSDAETAPQLAAPAGSPAVGWALPTRLQRPAVAGIAVGAGLCLAVSLIIFTREGAIRNVAWALYLISMALGLILAWRLDQPARQKGLPWTRRDTVSLVVILLIAAFYRLWNIGVEPAGLWFDEAAHGLDVMHLLSDPAFRPIFLTTSMSPETALHWYFDAIFFVLFGPTIFSLRISAIIAGLIGVVGVYFLARQLFGWRTGVIAAGFLAVASWHVNFSRFMMIAIWSVTFSILAMYLLYQALRTGRYRYFALSGMCVGIGLNLYFSSRLFCGVIAIFVLYWLVREREPIAFLRRNLAGLVVLGAFVLLSAGPLIEFALLHPAEFDARLAEVSVFSEVQKLGSLEPLTTSLTRHLEMFNYIGDPNGRHNLSGSPELDQVMGALFILGLALALRRWKCPEYALPLVWFPIMLAGGIFSLSFEAPQSHRTLDNSVVTVLFAAIPVGAVWSRLTWAKLTSIRLPTFSRPAGFNSVTVSAGALLALALFGWAAILDYHKYFVLQAQDNRTWAEYQSPQTEIGRELSQLDLTNTDVYLSSVYVGNPTIRFLAPKFKDPKTIEPATDLPFQPRRAVAAFLADTDDRSVLAIQRLYPNATVRTYSSPGNSSPGLYSVYVSAADVTSLQGLNAEYYSGPQVTGKPARTGRDPTINFDWSQATTPLPLPFTVNWSGVLAAPQFGAYLLKVQGPPGSAVYVDENLVVQGASQQSVTLAQGLHAFRMVTTVTTPMPVHLLWQPPGVPVPVPVPPGNLFGSPAAARGLLGKYYPGPAWQGQPAKEEVDPSLKFNFHIIPLPRPYSVDWSGKLDVPLAGAYAFATDSIDSSWIYVDGKLVATNQGHPDHVGQGSVRLTEGLHDFEVKFQDSTGFSYLTVYWQPPGFPQEPIPGERLFPPQGAYPVRAGPLKQSRIQPSPGGLPSATAPSQAQAPAGGNGTAPASIGPLPVSALHQLQSFGEPGQGPGQLQSPRGVDVDAQGNVYVVDTDLVRIEKFDSTGKFLLAWGSKGDGGQDQFQEPVDLLVDAQGHINVLDSTTGWIKQFDSDGKFITQFGGPSLTAYHPRSLAADTAGNLYLADAGTSHIIELAPTGVLIQKYGNHGTDAGQIAEPVGVAVAADGSVYVADSAASRLSHFDSTFHLIQSWAIPRSSSVLGPKIVVADDQSVYVSDPDGHRIIHFDAQGQPTDQIGGPGELRRPVGFRDDGHGNFYVADAEAGRVFKYGPQ
jgi:streptogramin lyase/4-amino-4-deoxy-L-arabinose transferase-like glycosyltransferase